MIYEDENFSFEIVEDDRFPKGYRLVDNMPNVQPGDQFIFCNLGQFDPDTEIFAGIPNIKVIDCNTTNCLFGNNVEVSRCNHTRVVWDGVQYGSNKNKKLFEKSLKYTDGKRDPQKIMNEVDRKEFFRTSVFLNKKIAKRYKREIEEAKR